MMDIGKQKLSREGVSTNSVKHLSPITQSSHPLALPSYLYHANCDGKNTYDYSTLNMDV